MERDVRIFGSPILRLIDVRDAELMLPTAGEATVDELYSFGAITLAESRQRYSWVQTKLTAVLGWSTGSLALLLVGSLSGTAWGKTLAALFAICALIASAGLKTRMTAAMSERDWFRDELLSKPPMLKRYHVVSLLLCHQQYTKSLRFKGECLRYAEWLLALGAICLAGTMFMGR